MSEERTALERVTSKVLEWGGGAWVDRMAPISVGAVVGSVAVIGAGSVLRFLLRRSRTLRWAGTLVAVPVGIWLLLEYHEQTESRREDRPEADLGQREPEALSGSGNDDVE